MDPTPPAPRRAALAAVGVTSMLVSALLVGRIVRLVGETRALFCGLGMGAAGFGLYAWAPDTRWIFAAIAVGSLWSAWGAAAQSLPRVTGPAAPGRRRRAPAP